MTAFVHSVEETVLQSNCAQMGIIGFQEVCERCVTGL